MNPTLDRYFRWLLRNRRIVLAIIAMFLAIGAAGAVRVRVDYSVEQFFPTWGPERNTYERYKRSFPKEDTRFSLFWQDSHSPDANTYWAMKEAALLFEEVGLQDVRWIGGVRVAKHTDLGGESALQIGPLIDQDSLSDVHLRSALARHRSDNLLRGYLWNDSQTVFGIHGYLDQDENTDRRRREVEEALTDKLSSLGLDGTTLVLGGIPVVRSQLPKLLQADQVLFLLAGFPIFFAILFFFFRNVGQTLLCLISILPAYVVTVGLMGFVGKSVTVLTIFIPIIILVVGVSDAIHFVTLYRNKRLSTQQTSEAVVLTFSELAVPCFYTSLTTAIGFASLAGTRIQLVVDFGVFTAIAIFLTFAFSMTLLPVLLSFSFRDTFDNRGLNPAWMRGIVQAAATFAVRPSKLIGACFLLTGVVALGLGAKLRVNTFLVDDLKDSTDLIRDLRWVEANGFGLFQVNLFLRQTGEHVLHHPDALAWVEDFQTFVRADPLVVNTVALPDYLKQLRQAAMNGEREDRVLPASVEESSQLLLLAELEDAEFVEEVYHQTDGEAQVIVAVRDEGSAVMLPLLERIDGYLEENPPPVGTAVSTGTVKLLQEFTTQLLRSFGPSLLVALILISAVMIHLFRSVKYGLLALVPNLFPLVVLLGVMKLGGFDLKPSTILVFSIAFGLAVDDTIHLLGRFRQIISRGTRADIAMKESLIDTGPAILKTTVVVGGGFSLLMVSQFEVMFLVGFMTVVSAVSAVVADLFLFPAIISMASRTAARRQPLPGRIQEA